MHIKPLINAIYGFATSDKKVQQNKKKYVMLVTHGAFTCKEPQLQHYRFENKIIPTAIIEHFFSHCKAPRILWEDDFDPIKPKTLALIVTIVEHCIEEWADGIHKTNKLDDNIQAPCYKGHTKDILAWCKEEPDIMTKIRKCWVAKRRQHVDIKPKQDSSGFIDDNEKERLHTDLQG
ncbi:hypothetical protein IW262DRAFT_1463842 [Armillaria fumosa]|nr:hypothetical protein IW262DRAFT_1463842 [Armillaria fumosa]